MDGVEDHILRCAMTQVQVYTHFPEKYDPFSVMITPLVTWMYDQFNQGMERGDPKPPHDLEIITTPIKVDMVEQFLRDGSIEKDNLDLFMRMDPAKMEPVLMGALGPDNEYFLMDGRHRIGALHCRGIGSVCAILVPEKVWRAFLVPTMHTSLDECLATPKRMSK